jgi:hypothetical protein
VTRRIGLAESGACGLQFAQRLPCEYAKFLSVRWIGPASVSTLEGEDSQFGGETRSRIEYATFLECLGHRRCEADVLEGVTSEGPAFPVAGTVPHNGAAFLTERLPRVRLGRGRPRTRV